MNYFNSLDFAVSHFINQFAGKSETFDSWIIFSADYPILKGGVVASILWGCWFRSNADGEDDRKKIIATIIATVITLVFTKALRSWLPFRPRPIHTLELNFYPPYHVSTDTLWNWSSFPSDTAGFIFALSMGVFMISRRLGVLAMLYSFLMVCLPRIYLGYHFLSDVIIGAAIGVLVGWVLCTTRVRDPVSHFPMLLSQQNSSLFYAIIFLILYEIASVFENSRMLITFILRKLT